MTQMNLIATDVKNFCRTKVFYTNFPTESHGWFGSKQAVLAADTGESRQKKWHIVWLTIPFFQNVLLKALELTANKRGKDVVLAQMKVDEKCSRIIS